MHEITLAGVHEGVRRPLAVLTGLVVSLALGLTACGEQGGGGGAVRQVQGNTLTVYSSLPLQGATRGNSEAVNNGAKLALKQAGGKAGNFQLKFVELDDATAAAGKWDPGPVNQNARKAVQDKTTIAYLGEFNSGASAISIPILNKAGIFQVSPSNTGVGLTVADPAEPGTPDKYYPAGKRHYARVVPKDSVQGPALVTAMKDDGCTSVSILNDKEVYGKGLAGQVEKAAKENGLQVQGNEGIDIKAPNYRSQAEGIQADCFFFGGITASNGVQVLKDVAAANPDVKLYAGDGSCESAAVNPSEGGMPEDVSSRYKCTAPFVPAEKQPEEAGRKFFADFEQEYNEPNPEPYAIYGYESMALILDAIERAGPRGNDSQAVIDAALGTENRKSVLGEYSIDDNGDTTLTTEALFGVENGELSIEKNIEQK
ncbi:MAG: branched-chain amino acid ABC transporter substrate-binding protein [Actinomycetota bacterium]|jgi:branched-chain amino acid transport system substrate-binding protein|nr:branched-chain amino acid ABC transporter substrate-binding protein [Actinomycetota bacterium]